MQHLRSVGVQEEGVESILIEAPVSSRNSAQRKRRIDLQDLPPEVLPSLSELPKSYAYESQQAIPSSIAGFQPDMDPHLRQTLEALDDDAFVDDDLEDDCPEIEDGNQILMVDFQKELYLRCSERQ